MLPKTGDAGGSEGGEMTVGGGDVSGGGKLSQGSSAADLLAAEFNFSFIFSDLPASNDIKEDGMSSMVWVVLFSVLILLSLAANLALVLAVLSNRRKRTKVHLLISLLFLVNLSEYSLLLLEFSQGVSSHFPWSEWSCSAYQLVLESNPLFYAAILAAILYHARGKSSLSLLLSLLLLIVLVLFISLPTILFSGLALYPTGARFCVMDLSGVGAMVGLEPAERQTVTALYYMLYRSVLPYFLPLCIMAPQLKHLYSRINGPDDKNSTISLALAVISSYFVFYSCYSVTVFIRHGVEVSLISISARNSWLLAVLQSLFTLLATFQHVFRPLLCFVLDIDLRKDLMSRLCRRKRDGRGGVTYTIVQQSTVSANIV